MRHLDTNMHMNELPQDIIKTKYSTWWPIFALNLTFFSSLHSHLTWEVNECIHVDEFCQLIENYSNWLHKEEYVNQDSNNQGNIVRC